MKTSRRSMILKSRELIQPGNQDTKIPGVILAAGEGCRFNSGNKLLQPFKNNTIIHCVLQNALNSGLDPVLLVLGYDKEKILKGLGDLRAHPKLGLVFNEGWHLGRASSVKAAIKRLPEEVPGVVFLLGDMPLITTALIDQIANTFIKTGKLCFPLYQGRKGHPVAFPKSLFPKLLELEGDTSGYSVVRQHWVDAVKTPLKDEHTQLDLDTEADYERLLRWEVIVG